jgi:hypothetical protein
MRKMQVQASFPATTTSTVLSHHLPAGSLVACHDRRASPRLSCRPASVMQKGGCDLSVRHLIRLCLGPIAILYTSIRQYGYISGVIIDSNKCGFCIVAWMAIPLAALCSRDYCAVVTASQPPFSLFLFYTLDIYSIHTSTITTHNGHRRCP